MLDYDGALALFREDRDKAVPYPGVEELLGALLKAQSARGILVSGRGNRDLVDKGATFAIKGRGIAILLREAFRETAADIWIRPPNKPIDFPARWLDASGGRK